MPAAGAGPRDALLTAFDVVVRRSEELGEGDRGWIVNGLRGVGKTVLLDELLRRAGERDWITAKVEAGAGQSLSGALSRALVRGMRTATGRHPDSRLRRMLGVFKAFSLKADTTGVVSLGVEVDPIGGVADSGRFADDLAKLFEVMGETARDLGIGVLILIDELHEAKAGELAAINTAVQHLGQAEGPLPLMLVGAGLPSLPAGIRTSCRRSVNMCGTTRSLRQSVCMMLVAKSTTGSTAPGGSAPTQHNATYCARWPTWPATGRRRCPPWRLGWENRAPATCPSHATNSSRRVWSTLPNAACWPSPCRARTSSSSDRMSFSRTGPLPLIVADAVNGIQI